MPGEAAQKVWLWGMIAVVAAVQIVHLLIYGGELLLSPDSVSYIAVARNLVAGNGLIVSDGSALIFWPPLYAALLSIFLYLGFDLLATAAVLNAISLALIALTCGLWLRWRTGNYLLGIIGVAVILISRPLWYIHVFVWTEPLFALLVLWALLILQRYFDSGNFRVLLAAAVLSAIACLVRYPGIFLIGAGGLALLARSGVGWLRRIRDSLVYSGVAVAPIFAWWWWSVGRSADPGGQRIFADRSLLQAPSDMISTLGNWGVPWSFPTPAKLAVLLAVAGVVLLLLGWRRSGQPPAGSGSQTRADSLGWFAVVYGLGVLGLALFLAFDMLRDRILSPLYAPLALWVLVWGWNRLSALPGGRWRQLVGVFLVILIGVWVGRSALTTSRMVDYEHRHAEDFSKPRWRESETLGYLRDNSPDGLLYSNIPHVVYLYTQLRTVESPREHYFDSRRTKTNDLAEFRGVLAGEGEIRMVWFEDEEPNDYHYPLDELREYFDFKLVSEFEDGAIYRVEPKVVDASSPR
jgi:4-amino-4-deoxy-L-arabinose transferase-like glycosyltransferase